MILFLRIDLRAPLTSYQPLKRAKLLDPRLAYIPATMLQTDTEGRRWGPNLQWLCCRNHREMLAYYEKHYAKLPQEMLEELARSALIKKIQWELRGQRENGVAGGKCADRCNHSAPGGPHEQCECT
jgi:GH43 family beta-xylosidase